MRMAGGERPSVKLIRTKNDLCDMEVGRLPRTKIKISGLVHDAARKNGRVTALRLITKRTGWAYAVNSILKTRRASFFSFSDGKFRTVTRFDGEKFEPVKPNSRRKATIGLG